MGSEGARQIFAHVGAGDSSRAWMASRPWEIPRPPFRASHARPPERTGMRTAGAPNLSLRRLCGPQAMPARLELPAGTRPGLGTSPAGYSSLRLKMGAFW